MTRSTRIELFKENFKFSSGHFTIFSATERENIHGHNFTVHVAFDVEITQDGIMFDYAIAKEHIQAMCGTLNEYFLVPERSRHLRIERGSEYITLHFNGEKIPFLPRDVKFLPVENITVEQLSTYLLGEFIREFVQMGDYAITTVELKVFSGPGQCANASWARSV